MNKRLMLPAAIIAALILAAAPMTAGAAETGLMTDCTVLVGYAENGGPHGGVTLIVPGTLIPALEGEAWPTDISTLEEQLKDAYRLEKMRVASRSSKRLEAGIPADLPTADGIEATLTLLGHNDSVATYRAEMTLNGQSLASASLSVSLGRKAVMGSRLADAANEDPYIFLVVEASHPDEVKCRMAGKDGITKPRPIDTVNPTYPKQARKDGLSGNVIVEATVDVDGTVVSVKAVESPGDLLSEAAMEAVRQWTFEPGLDADGNPVKTRMTMVIKFALK
jgi:TonB family protein